MRSILTRNAGWRNVRDLLTWALGTGVAITAYIRTGRIDYSLYPLIGGCLGLPFIFRAEDPNAPHPGIGQPSEPEAEAGTGRKPAVRRPASRPTGRGPT